MKLLVSLALLFCSIGAFAQTWAPFPLDETSEWRERFGFLAPDPSGTCFDNYYRNYEVVDTVQLNGNEYFDLGFTERFWVTWVFQPCSTAYQWPGVLSSGSAGLFRADNGKLLMLDDTNEVVFFDFTSAVGDTVEDPFHGTYVVDSVDQVIVGDNVCRRLRTHGWEMNPIWIIENIGHARGLFGYIHFFENDGSLCYLENQVPLASGGAYNACVAVGINSPEGPLVKLSPNPSTGIFRIETPQKSNYSIYDAFGRLVKDGQLDGASEIDISSQPNGIYLITIESEKGLHFEKLVKQ